MEYGFSTRLRVECDSLQNLYQSRGVPARRADKATHLIHLIGAAANAAAPIFAVCRTVFQITFISVNLCYYQCDIIILLKLVNNHYIMSNVIQIISEGR